MIRKEKGFFYGQVLFSFAAVLFTLILVRGREPVISYTFAKGLVLPLLYCFFYLSNWMNCGIFTAAVLTICAVIRFTRKEKNIFQNAQTGCLISGLSVLLCFYIVVLKTGYADAWNPSLRTLQVISFIGLESLLIGITGWLRTHGPRSAGRELQLPAWLYTAVPIAAILCYIPIVLSGRYVYPQGDDFDYSALCHRVWVEGQGFSGVLKAAFAQVAEAYVGWQGTFSSLFLMALQPGVCDTDGYHLVPFLLSFLCIAATCLLFYALLYKICGASKKETVFTASCVSLLIVQLVPAKAHAFFWYNGAIHYMGSFSFLICFLSFVLLACQARTVRKRRIFLILSAPFGILAGGGDLVSGLTGCILIGYLFILFIYLKKKECLKPLLFSGFFLLAAFLANVLSPGFPKRDMRIQQEIEYGAIGSILKSFQVCFTQAAGEFVSWYLLLLLLVLSPVLWNIARRCRFRFPLPGIVSLASYCMLSAMYTPLIFALGEWRLGRIQDIIYFAYVLLLTLNEFYLFGWIQRKKGAEAGFFLSPRTFYALTAAGLVITGLLTVGTPQKVTSAAILDAIRTGEAQRYAACIQRNIDLLETTEKTSVQVEKPPRTPTVFVDEEIEPWRCGTAEFFGKEKVYYSDEAE